MYYTLLKSALLEQPGFKHVWIDGLGMDPWGRKMSILGNGIDVIVTLNVAQEDEQVVEGTRTRWFGRPKRQNWERCFRLWKACEAQVGDELTSIQRKLNQEYFSVNAKIFNVADLPASLLVQEEDHLLCRLKSFSSI